MTRRGVRDLLVGLLLAVAGFLGVLYQVNESAASSRSAQDGGNLPQLFCPLH